MTTPTNTAKALVEQVRKSLAQQRTVAALDAEKSVSPEMKGYFEGKAAAFAISILSLELLEMHVSSMDE